MEKYINISSALLTNKKSFPDFIPVRIFILFTLQTLLTFNLSAQPVTQEWVRTYNGPDNGQDIPKKLIVDNSGNIYVTGMSYRTSPDPGHDIVTIKYSQLLGVTSLGNSFPDNYRLSQNYPNPFNPSTKIKFDIPPSKGARGMTAKIVIYDVLGREVAVLVNEELTPGTYEIDWDGSRYSSGIYFYRVVTSEFIDTKKMVLIK